MKAGTANLSFCYCPVSRDSCREDDNVRAVDALVLLSENRVVRVVALASHRASQITRVEDARSAP